MAITLLRFLNIICASLLAGSSFGIWMGFNPMHFPAAIYITLQQNTIRMLNGLMITLVIVAMVITVISAILQRNNRRTFFTLLVAATFFVGCMLISRFGNQPINESIMTWNANTPPPNWTLLRDQWWFYHILRTITELIALTLITWTSIKKGNIHITNRPFANRR